MFWGHNWRTPRHNYRTCLTCDKMQVKTYPGKWVNHTPVVRELNPLNLVKDAD